MAKPRVQKASIDQGSAGRGADQFMVRFPAGVRDRLAQMAANNGRSMNAEVIAAVEQHLKGPDRLAAVEAFIEKHRAMIDEMSAYEWFGGKDSVLGDLSDLQKRVQKLEDSAFPNRFEND